MSNIGSPDAPALPPWLQTEHGVREVFTILGFEVESLSVGGRQIDLVAKRHRDFDEPETWIVEVTTERVDVDKGSKDAQKIRQALREHGGRGMIVSTRGFTDDQKQSLKSDGITCLTYDELERKRINLTRYAVARKEELKHVPNHDIGFDASVFVEPNVHVHRSFDNGTAGAITTSLQWIREICAAPTGVVGALLGDLGTGKSTILQHAQLVLLEEYLEDSSNRPVPIFVPLGQFKHYSGRVDALLQQVFAQAGIDTYPAAALRTLAASGRVVYFFDGLDEVHPVSSIDDLVRTVTTLLDYIGKNARAIISSRTHLFARDVEEYAMFGPYELQKIRGVSEHLRRLLAGHATTELAYAGKFTKPQVDEYLTKALGKEEGARVRARIESIYGFDEMAQTPVLLAMMRVSIPEILSKGETFGVLPELRLYEAYTNRWISRDEGRARLSTEQRMHLSKELAARLIRRDSYAASWSEIQEMLRASPGWDSKPIGDEAAEIDVRNSTFLIREGAQTFRFAHRSIMEYFSAMNSLERLVSGERPEQQISDGHGHFLSLLIADRWIATPDRQPLQVQPIRDDDWAGWQRLDFLSKATRFIPATTHPKPALRDVTIQTTKPTNPLTFRNIRVVDLRIKSESLSTIEFVDCALEGANIEATRVVGLSFRGGASKNCDIKLPRQEWSKVTFYPGPVESLTKLKVEVGLQRAAEWVSRDSCRAFVGPKFWTAPYASLCVADDVAKRLLGRGKTSVDTWNSSFPSPLNGELLVMLKREGLVAEDASRQPHQLSLTSEGIEVFGGFEKDPFKYQARIKKTFG